MYVCMYVCMYVKRPGTAAEPAAPWRSGGRARGEPTLNSTAMYYTTLYYTILYNS